MLRPCLDKTEISIRSSASNIGPSPLERPGVAVGQLRIADRVGLIAPVTEVRDMPAKDISLAAQTLFAELL
jgi:hypothetical protein